LETEKSFIRNDSDSFLYRKKLYKPVVSDGVGINSVSSAYPTYIGNGEIVYRNGSDSDKLYKKSVNDISNGTAINSVISFSPTYIGTEKSFIEMLVTQANFTKNQSMTLQVEQQ
jgi:hypothetical protein